MGVRRRSGVFVSYSHKDDRWLERLQAHLKPYVRRGDLTLWDDTRIQPGDLWQPAIRGAIENAVAFVLLVSADFLASDFIVSEELPRVLNHARSKGARVLSLVVRPCKLDAHPAIAAYHALNPPDRPLSKMRLPKAEESLADAAEKIAGLLGNGDETTERDADERLFQDLRSATTALAVLQLLTGQSNRQPAYTITELIRALNIESRRLMFAEVERLLAAGWIEKSRLDDKNTRFSATAKGSRQLQRLRAASDDPLRGTS